MTGFSDRNDGDCSEPRTMPKTTNWKDIKSARVPRADSQERKLLAQEALDEELDAYVAGLAGLRRNREVNQVDLAATLGVHQSQVSNLERQDDMLLSSLRRYIEGLGGELHIVATFPNSEDVTIVVGEELLATS